MKFLLIGSEGSIGSRYKAILDYLKLDYDCYDPMLGKGIFSINEYRLCTHVIIASPTDTHLYYLDYLNVVAPEVKVLCEKPISKDIGELESFFKVCKLDLVMVNNYSFMINFFNDKKITKYNFFKTGNDGLAWDCIQLIRIANAGIELRNDSPIWQCTINGEKVDNKYIDTSYIHMLKNWMSDYLHNDFDELLEAHKKTEKLQKMVVKNGKYESLYWNPSED